MTVDGRTEDMDDLIERHRAEILRIAASHGLSNVRLFGSFARGEATDDSDVDLLADLDLDGHGPFEIMRAERTLSALLGRSVDIRTDAEVRRIMDRIERDVIAL